MWGLSLGSSQRRSSVRRTLAHHWQASRFIFFDRETPQGMPMMRKACADRHLRIIGKPSPSAAEIRRGMPMMRFAHRSRAYRIIGMPSRRLAYFGAGLPMMRLSQVLPHHWHAFRAFGIVLACIFEYVRCHFQYHCQNFESLNCMDVDDRFFSTYAKHFGQSGFVESYNCLFFLV